MAAASRAVLALLPLLSGAVVVKELPNSINAKAAEANSTDAKATEQPWPSAPIQEHAAVATRGSGIPFVATSVQLVVTQIVEPVKERLLTLREWVVAQLTALDAGLNKTHDMPSEALELFATKFSAIFQAVEEKLEPVTSRLAAGSPAIDGLNQVLQATGNPGVAHKITEVMDGMSKKVLDYQKILSSSTALADDLKGLGKDDWHKAGPKIKELKKSLDKGASTIQAFGDALQRKVEKAMAVLAGKLGVDASIFAPVSKAAGDGWRFLGESSSALAADLVSASQALPPQITEAAAPSGAAAPGALGALGAAAVAALVL